MRRNLRDVFVKWLFFSFQSTSGWCVVCSSSVPWNVIKIPQDQLRDGISDGQYRYIRSKMGFFGIKCRCKWGYEEDSMNPNTMVWYSLIKIPGEISNQNNDEK